MSQLEDLLLPHPFAKVKSSPRSGLAVETSEPTLHHMIGESIYSRLQVFSQKDALPRPLVDFGCPRNPVRIRECLNS